MVPPPMALAPAIAAVAMVLVMLQTYDSNRMRPANGEPGVRPARGRMASAFVS